MILDWVLKYTTNFRGRLHVCMCWTIYDRVHMWYLRRRLQSRTGAGNCASCFTGFLMSWRIAGIPADLEWECMMSHTRTIVSIVELMYSTYDSHDCVS